MKGNLTFLWCLAGMTLLECSRMSLSVAATLDSLGITPAVPEAAPFQPAAPPDEPRLGLTQRAGELVISWPSSATNLMLEQAPGLAPPARWARVAPSLLATNSDTIVYSLHASDRDGAFFRLRALDSLPSLSAQWSLDEGSGQEAQDTRALGGTLFLSAVSWAGGRIGPGSLQLNGAPANAAGSRAWVSNANYRVLPPAGQPFTVSLWLNPDALTPGWRAIAGNDVPGAAGWQIALHTLGPGTNDLVFTGAGGDSLSVTGRTLLLPGEWRLLTVTYDGTAGSIYLDGALLARGSGSLTTHAGPIYFGGGLAGYDSFLGRMDEIQLWVGALDAEQVSLKGYWQFDESGGGTLLDSGPAGTAATLSSSSARVAGRHGLGVDLTAGQIVIPNSDLAVLPGSGGAFSLSFWLRPSAIPSAPSSLIHCGDGASGWQLTVEADAGGEHRLRWESRSGGGTLDVAAPFSPTNGAWTKVDLTYDGGIATLFINARRVESASGAIRGSRAAIVLGAGPGAMAFPGVIDDLKIFGRERQPWEVGPVASTMWETALQNGTTNLALQGFGPVGSSLAFELLTLPAATNGAVLHSAGSTSVTYQAGSRRGPDAFAYVVSDGEFTSAPALVCVSVVTPHWLSPTGGTAQPQDGSSPANAWAAPSASAIDALWATNNYYDCFFYAPGVYQTHGWKYFERSSANEGCKHIGSGSTGPGSSTIQLVDIWAASAEETIFAPAAVPSICNNFEIQHLVLDCNAEHVPKYTRGEPTWIRIPLASTSRVDTVTLNWANTAVPGFGWRIGPAVEFNLCARRFGTNVAGTNCLHISGTPPATVVPVGTEADELYLELDLKGLGVDFYGLNEVTVQGGRVSLPSATVPGAGESRLGQDYSILHAFDNDPSTAWASGPEASVQITVPMNPGSVVDGLSLEWNCKSYEQPGQLGPASELIVRARDEITGLDQDVPAVRHARGATGAERITFEAGGLPRAIVTDRLTLLLTAREAGVQYYSLREIAPLHDGSPTPPRLPTALSRLAVGDYSALRAFDADASTAWANSVQGMVGAINVNGSNLKFSDLKVIGFGTKAGRECFPMGGFYGFPGPPVHLGNVLIEHCQVVEPARHNTDGITAVDVARMAPHTLTNVIVRNNRVAGLKSLFTYSHGFVTLDTQFCEVEDCQVGVYWEPDRAAADDVGAFVVRSNRFLNVTHGIYFLFHADSLYGSLTAVGNEIALDARQGWGLLSCDTCDPGLSGSMTNATILNNLVRYTDWSSPPGGGGLHASDIHHAVFGNNILAMDPAKAMRVRACPSGVIPPPPPSEDCDHPLFVPPPIISYPACLDILPPGYDRAWFNNRHLNGSLLPVRWLNLGVDGFSSQQQYAE